MQCRQHFSSGVCSWIIWFIPETFLLHWVVMVTKWSKKNVFVTAVPSNHWRTAMKLQERHVKQLAFAMFSCFWMLCHELHRKKLFWRYTTVRQGQNAPLDLHQAMESKIVSFERPPKSSWIVMNMPTNLSHHRMPCWHLSPDTAVLKYAVIDLLSPQKAINVREMCVVRRTTFQWNCFIQLILLDFEARRRIPSLPHWIFASGGTLVLFCVFCSD